MYEAKVRVQPTKEAAPVLVADGVLHSELYRGPRRRALRLLSFPLCPRSTEQILKAEYWQKGSNKSGAEGPHYYVHYKGWKQTCVGAPAARTD